MAGHDEAGEHGRATGPCRPTAVESREARIFVDDTEVGLARFARARRALASGYAPHRPGPETFKHYFNPRYVTDGRVLDPIRPEGLLYVHTNRGPVLIAAVYLMNRAGRCPRGQVPGAAPPMMHTWVIKIPGGPLRPPVQRSGRVPGAACLPEPILGVRDWTLMMY